MNLKYPKANCESHYSSILRRLSDLRRTENGGKLEGDMENHPRIILQKGAEAERETSFPVARVFFFPLFYRMNVARMPEVPSADFRQKRPKVRKWRAQRGGTKEGKRE